MLTKLLTVKMAAAAAAAVLGGGAAAAATGALPPSLQSGVSHGLSTVGISVPDPGGSPSGQPGTSTSTPPSQGRGPSVTGPAQQGLCTAFAASAGSQAASHSVAFRNLQTAASAAKESVSQYCAGPPAPATASNTEGSSDTVGNRGRPATPGSSQDGTGQGNPAATRVPPAASDHAGAGSANAASDHAGAGSANAAGDHGATRVPPAAGDHASARGAHGGS